MAEANAVPARFKPGDAVGVRLAIPIGHVRTPFYIRGKTGVVERYCGHFGNPEDRAYARVDGPRLPLYRVRFMQRNVWPKYSGNEDDTVDVEIFQNWLEAK
jgi:nitrile hydratase subunit beta